ncbi:MAG: hypothetical protein ACP5IX_02055 [Patescibacteria group bacterium]
MKKLLFLALILIVWPMIGQACFNPTDSFAVEIWLNKPGLSYNLTNFRQESEDELLIQESDIIYRSHYNPELAIILREINQGEPLV